MKRRWLFAVVAGVAFSTLCDRPAPALSGGGPYDPEIIPADFVDEIDNPYFTMTPGAKFFYEKETEEGLETVVVQVTHQKKVILGVTCTQIRDTVKLDGELVEDTLDWFAQHEDGTVWYFGEFSTDYENGQVAGHEGSWEAGVDGAKPGIIMLAHPKKGQSYRQEYYPGVAEDMGKVLSLDGEVEIEIGEFEECLKTREWTPLERGFREHKYYAPGVGLVLVVDLETGDELQLVAIE